MCLCEGVTARARARRERRPGTIVTRLTVRQERPSIELGEGTREGTNTDNAQLECVHPGQTEAVAVGAPFAFVVDCSGFTRN